MSKRLLSMFLSIIMCAGLIFSLNFTVQALPNNISGFSPDVVSEFKSPSDEYRAGARFVVNDFNASNPDNARLLRECLADMKAKGYSFIELENHINYNTAKNSYSAFLHTIFDICNDLNIMIGVRMGGTAMGQTVPGSGTALSLASGTFALDNNTLLNGAAATGTQAYASTNTFDPEKLVAVLAVTYKTVAGNRIQTNVEQLDLSKFTYLVTSSTTSSRNIRVEYIGTDKAFTVGADENIAVIVYYSQNRSGTDFYSYDSGRVFAENCASAFDDTAYLTSNPGTRPLKEKMAENGSWLVFDGGNGNQTLPTGVWSNELIAKFDDKFGYDFTDLLAVQYSGYGLEDSEAKTLINNDWNYAMAYLFNDYNAAITKFVEDNYNGGWRAQAGFSTALHHQVAVANGLTSADVETLYSCNEIDNYASVISAGRLSGQKIFNMELSAIWKPYNTGWHEFLWGANLSFLVGVNRMFAHTVSFNYSEGASATVRQWPGYSYQNAYSLYDWGVTNPTYVHTEMVNDYIGRAQYLLQAGTESRDLLIYNDTFSMRYEVDDLLQRAGYTFEIVSPEVLRFNDVQKASNGIIDPHGGAYKAFVISFQLSNKYMPLDTAETILKYAQNGVPIFVVGNEQTFIDNLVTQNYSSDIAGDTAKLKAIWNSIKEIGITFVQSEAVLTEALKSAGVLPYADKNASSSIYSNRINFDDGSSYYYLFNEDIYYNLTSGSGFFSAYTTAENNYFFPERVARRDFVGSAISQTMYFKGTGVPYLLNLWSGEITPIADYKILDNGYVAVNISLEPGEARVIGFTGNSVTGRHAASLSTNQDITYKNGNLVLRATEGGTYTGALSDGTYIVNVSPDSIGTVTLGDKWKLSVQSWVAAYPGSSVTLEGIVTANNTLTAELTSLIPWRNITFTNETGGSVAGTNISGVGTYSTTLTVSGNVDGAYLDLGMLGSVKLGTVYGTAKVFINGMNVALNQDNMIVDISDYITNGANTLEIEVPSNLGNARLTGTARDYGLVGPITIIPFVEVTLANVVDADIRADEASVVVNTLASYTVSLSNAAGVGTVELNFTFDGYALDKDSITATPLNGFALGIYPDLAFEYLGLGMWKGSVKYMYLADRFVNTNSSLDILKISGTAIGSGAATITLTSFTVSGDNGTGVGQMPSQIRTADATADIGSKPAVYSKYDLNKNGSIDETDLLYLVYFYQWNDRDADWDTVDLYGIFAKDCDFQINGKVDLADMIELTANYGVYDPYA